MPHTREGHIHEHRHDGLISAIGVGGFLIIVGSLFLCTPTLWQNIVHFFQDLTIQTVPGTTNVLLPAPANPADYHVFYRALVIFEVAIGVLEVVLFLRRIWSHSSTHKIADKAADMGFGCGAAVLVQIFHLQGTLSSWFQYWTALIILIGITMIARAIVHFARR